MLSVKRWGRSEVLWQGRTPGQVGARRRWALLGQGGEEV